MAQQSWVALANDVPTAADITSHTFTGPTDITIGTTGTLGRALQVPAGGWRVGQTWRFNAGGTYSVTGTPTLKFGIYVSTSLQAENAALTASSGVTSMNWQISAMGVVRSLGTSTSGTMIVQGYLSYAVTSNTAAPTILPIAQSPVGVGTGFDTETAALPLTLKATYSASSASNIVVLKHWTVEYLN